MKHPQQVILQTELDGKLLVLTAEGPGGADMPIACESGLYAVWGETQNEFIAFNLSEEELIEMFVQNARNEITRKVRSTCHELKCGEKPYGQFTKTLAEAVHRGQQMHGEDNYMFKEAE